jgi:RHS repeat-associated protein
MTIVLLLQLVFIVGSRKRRIREETSILIFDSNGDLIKVTGPVPYGASDPFTITMTYNSDRQRTSYNDGKASYTYTYHANGKLDRVTDGTAAYRDYTYSGANLTQVDTNSGTKLTLYYDNTSFPNVPTRYEDGDGNTWTTTLNSFGQPATVVPPTGAEMGTTTFTYDTNTSSPTYGYLTSITNGAGGVTTFDSYSLLGVPTAITVTPETGVTVTEEYEYDAAGRMTQRTNDDATTRLYSYSGRELSQITDEASTAVSYSWCDGCGALDGVSEPMSRSLSWTRDDDRQVTTFTDARSNSTNYEYGPLGEIKKIDYPDPGSYSSYDEFEYDKSGRVVRQDHVIRGYHKTYSYDAAGRISQITPNHTTIDFNYDAEGRLSLLEDHPGDLTYAYTDSSLVESETHDLSAHGLSNEQHLEYEYYPDQLLKKITWKDDTTIVATWDFEYDGAGRLENITNSFGEDTAFAYDDDGKLTTQTNDNGTSTEITYNHSRGWPTQITYENGGGTFEEYDIEYDGGSDTVGLITQVDEYDSSSIAYGYDALYRLTSESRTGTQSYSQTFGYDLAGNITTKNSSPFGSYNEANEMTSWSGGTVWVGSIGGIYKIQFSGSTLMYTPGNGFTDPKEFSQGANKRSFIYDYDGTLRVIKEGTDKRYLLYAGGKLIAELKNGVPYKAYTWGPAGPVSQRILTGTPVSHWYHLGPQGETRHLTDSTGTVAASYYYNAYGERLGTVPSIDNPFQYGARYGYYQQEGYHDFIRVGNRWYIPALMRWDRRDQIRYNGGDNLYAYVRGNPVRYYDDGGNTPRESSNSICHGFAMSCSAGGAFVGGTVGAGVCLSGVGCLSIPLTVPQGAAAGAAGGYAAGFGMCKLGLSLFSSLTESEGDDDREDKLRKCHVHCSSGKFSNVFNNIRICKKIAKDTPNPELWYERCKEQATSPVNCHAFCYFLHGME